MKCNYCNKTLKRRCVDLVIDTSSIYKDAVRRYDADEDRIKDTIKSHIEYVHRNSKSNDVIYVCDNCSFGRRLQNERK